MTRTLFLTAAAFICLLQAAQADDRPGGKVVLFNGKDFAGWKKFVDPRSQADPDKIWTVENGVIRCEGSVNGYLITEKEYGDYVLRVQWKWGEKIAPNRGRNSGVFIHVIGPDKIWPRAIEAQLMADHAGDFWIVDDFPFKVDPGRQDPKVSRHYFRTRDGVEKPLGEWNQYEITCKGDTVRLAINGQVVNEGSAANPTRGKILLQSEGAEIFFRNVELEPIK